MSENPLNLSEHLQLRKKLSTVESSSIIDVWKSTPKGRRLNAVIRFLKLNWGAGKISSNEFIGYGFCDPDISLREQSLFAGKRSQQAFNKIYNDSTWYAVSKNKTFYETLMKGARIPCPVTVAIYDRKGRGAGAPVLQTQEELEGFLKDHDNLPIFAKPKTGLLSIGCFRVDKAEGDNLLINGRQWLSISHVCDYLQKISKKGYLFQEVLKPNKQLVEFSGDAIASVRFLILNFDDKIVLHSCSLKLPSNGEVADNFWREGAVLCEIDCNNGHVLRACQKHDNHISVINKSEKIYDLKLPDFQDARNIVLTAAKYFEGIKVQSWDVAFTDNGPVLIELNYGGDLNLLQLASNKGAMTPEYCDLLRKASYSGTLPN